MTLSSICQRPLIWAVLALWLAGCTPLGGPEDEEKDPHYLTGKSRVSSMDYDGAITAFESALAANPKNGAACLELGLLYEERKSNYAAAIYHFEKHLELHPDSNMAATIKQHILSCKLELAKTVPFALVSRQVQDDIRRLNATNSALSDQVKQLKAELAEQAVAFSNRLALATQVSFPTPTQAQIPVEPERRSNVADKPPSPVGSIIAARATPPSRTYVVRSGDTLVSIAKRLNVRLSSLQSANPRVEARRLKAGQTLNVPGGKD